MGCFPSGLDEVLRGWLKVVKGASVERMISEYFPGWGGSRIDDPTLNKASPEGPGAVLGSQAGQTLKSLLGSTWAVCGKCKEAVVCGKGPLLRQETREATRVRHVINTQRTPLQTLPQESTQSARNANIICVVSPLQTQYNLL